MKTALLKTDGNKISVTVLAPYGELNWRVRLEQDCRMHGSALKAGHIYIAGKSQLEFDQAGAPDPNGGSEQ